MIAAPLLDALHRSLVQCQLATFDQDASDRAIRLAVLVRVPDPHDASVGQLHASGSLDLQEERFDGIVDVQQFLAADRSLPCVDIGARPVGHDALAVDARTHALVLEFGIEIAKLDREQVVRRPVERNAVAFVALSTAVEQWLVVAGDEALGLAVGGEYLVCVKMPLEECADSERVAAVDRRRRCADCVPGCGAGLPREERAAARAERRPCVLLRVVVPARQFGEGDSAQLHRRCRGGGARWW